MKEGGLPSSAADGATLKNKRQVPLDIAAEAAVWVAALHGQNRSRQMELDCLEWQARSDVHRHAFECCTETWMAVPGVTVAQAYAAAHRAARKESHSSTKLQGARAWQWTAAAFLAIGITLMAVWQHKVQGIYETQIGGMQKVLLDDGTRMSLNTDTRVRVDMGERLRIIDIERGEALFEVAKDTDRRFVVRAAGTEVSALGTVFAVRLVTPSGGAQTALSVTLLEGQVAVQRPAEAQGRALPAPVLMKAGERMKVVARDTQPVARLEVDQPSTAALTAWTRSQVVFDDVPIAEAVAEMNRYSKTSIVLAGNGLTEGLRVSGQYRTGDNRAFAEALSSLHGLMIAEREERIELLRRSGTK